MDSSAWGSLGALMEPGESLLWTGQPDPARVARAAAARSVLGVAFVALGGYLLWPEREWWLSAGMDWRDLASLILADPMRLVAVVFTVVGASIAVAPFLAYRRAGQTAYAVTNHRVLRVYGKQADWLRIAELGEPEVRMRPGGSGDVLFRARAGTHDPSDRSRRDPFRAFLGIRNPEEVRQKIQKARWDATEESRTAFRSLRNRKHGFAIEVPEKWQPHGVDAPGTAIGGVAFEQIGEEWNSVNFTSPEGASLRIAIEDKAPESLDEVSARLQSTLKLTLGEMTAARSGTVAGGTPDYEFEYRMLGTRGRQIHFFRHGREYMLNYSAPGDVFPLHEATFSHVVNSLRLERGVERDTRSAASASQAATAGESAQTAKPATRHRPPMDLPSPSVPLPRGEGSTTLPSPSGRRVGDEGRDATQGSRSEFATRTPGRLSRNTGFILGLCVLSLFFDFLGYVLALAGLFLLWKHGKLKLPTRLGVTAVVLLPKVAIFLLGWNRITENLFELEPQTFATSSSIWAWSLLVCGVGVGCLMLAGAIRRGNMSALRLGKASFSPALSKNPGRKGAAVVGVGLIGLVFVAVSALMFLGLEDDFQAVEPDERGRWRLTHQVRGMVASFLPAEVKSFTGERDSGTDADLSLYWIRVSLNDGRSWSMNTRAMDAEEMLKKLAATMELPPGTMRLRMTPGREWVNSGRKVRPEDWAGTYRSTAGQGPSRDSVLEFRVVEGRLVGKETLRLGDRETSRELRNIQVTPSGEIEFETETLAGASKQAESRYRFSLNYAPRRRAALRDGFLDVDGSRYDRLAITPQ